MCVQHIYKGKISPQGCGKLLRLVLVYDTYTVSRNVPSYPGNEEALVRRPVYRLLTQGQKVYSCVY